MKRFGKILKMALVIIMVFSMIGCVQAPSITVPNGHVPTISENITSLAQSSNSTVKSRKYYYVDSIAERGRVILFLRMEKGLAREEYHLLGYIE